MVRHLQILGRLGVLGNFIGMLTDSRSFLSYTRHEYFRRILCNQIGKWVEDGEFPNDDAALKAIVEGICSTTHSATSVCNPQNQYPFRRQPFAGCRFLFQRAKRRKRQTG